MSLYEIHCDSSSGLRMERQSVEDMNRISLIYKGSLQLKKKTFEVEVPDMMIDGKDYRPVKTWFKYINKWVVSPLNC